MNSDPAAGITVGGTGISIEALQRLDQHLLGRYIEAGRIAGCLTLVARRGELAHLSAMGMMDRERNRPMAEDTIFRIYSMSKPITSAALMMLFERGAFQLSDPVSRFIPQWRDLQVMTGGEYPDYTTTAASPTDDDARPALAPVGPHLRLHGRRAGEGLQQARCLWRRHDARTRPPVDDRPPC